MVASSVPVQKAVTVAEETGGFRRYHNSVRTEVPLVTGVPNRVSLRVPNFTESTGTVGFEPTATMSILSVPAATVKGVAVLRGVVCPDWLVLAEADETNVAVDFDKIFVCAVVLSMVNTGSTRSSTWPLDRYNLLTVWADKGVVNNIYRPASSITLAAVFLNLTRPDLNVYVALISIMYILEKKKLFTFVV
jgi:hypothetical protein